MTEEEKIHHRCSTVDSNVGHRSYGSAISSSILVGIEPRRDSPSNNESRLSTDTVRFELPWESREELKINEGKDQSIERKEKHARRSKYFKKLHYAFGMLAIGLPFAGTLASTVIVTYSKEISTVILATTTLCSGVNAFFNFGRKCERHSEYENRYDEFANTIDKELSKPRRFRIPCDVCLEYTSTTLARLTAAAPDL